MWIKFASTKGDVCHNKGRCLPQQREMSATTKGDVCHPLFAGLVKQLMHLIGNLVVNKSNVPIMAAVFKKSEEVILQ